MKKRSWYEVIQVISKCEDGFPKEFYPGDTKHLALGAAKTELKSLRKEYPEAEYEIISNTSALVTR